MATEQMVGRSIPRTDGREKVTGAARYAADVRREGTLWGKVLRSPYPHARIRHIDASQADRVPGVHAVLTGADLAGAMCGRRIVDMPLLASGVVRFVGEPVAAVAAVDEDTAQQALDSIEVTYAELPAVFDAEEAAGTDAPLLHPGFNGYAGVTLQDTPSNVYATPIWGQGEPEEGFADADLTIEGTYTAAVVHQAYMEPHTCLVETASDGGMEVWASNKAPHYIREQVARATGVPAPLVRIHHVVIGGDFGGKGSAMNIPLCYFLAKAARRPVLMVMDYAEEFAAGNPRHAARIHVKMGLKRDGTFVACHVEGTFNTGAYAAFVPLGFLPGPRHAVGPYRIPHAKVVARHVYTNQVPSGHMRGPGEPQAIFAVESHIDVIARTLGLDPADVRLRNVVRDGDANALGERYHDLHGAETIEVALEAAGYHAPRPAPAPHLRYGRGVAIGERAPGGGETHASVTFRTDGSVVVHTSIFEQGSGTYTTMRQIVADVLGIPLDRIDLAVWDTDETGFDSGAGASRNSRMASEAAYDAATEAREALFRLAAELEGWPDDRMRFDGDAVCNTDTSQTIALTDLLARTDRTVSGRADYKDPTHANVTAFTVQVAEVAVDVETGQVSLLRFTSVHDAGRVLNPQGHDGQIRGGAMQGIGYGLMEELPIRDGRVATPSFADYKVPSIADIPEMQAIAVESDGGVGPFNIKGIGENPVAPVAPAIANAVDDAVGVRIHDLPITAEKVYAALRAKGG